MKLVSSQSWLIKCCMTWYCFWFVNLNCPMLSRYHQTGHVTSPRPATGLSVHWAHPTDTSGWEEHSSNQRGAGVPLQWGLCPSQRLQVGCRAYFYSMSTHPFLLFLSPMFMLMALGYSKSDAEALKQWNGADDSLKVGTVMFLSFNIVIDLMFNAFCWIHHRRKAIGILNVRHAPHRDEIWTRSWFVAWRVNRSVYSFRQCNFQQARGNKNIHAENIAQECSVVPFSLVGIFRCFHPGYLSDYLVALWC